MICKSSTCQAVPSCSQPSLTESIYFWPVSGVTFWAEERSVMMTSKAQCPSHRRPVCLRSRHTVKGAQSGRWSCGPALVYCVGSCTAWLSGLRASLSSVEGAARSPHACGIAGISAAVRFPAGQGDTDDALCSREALHGAQSHRHGPGLAVGLPAWLCVPRAVWKVQLSTSHGMEAWGVLPQATKVSLRVLSQVLGENESSALNLSFQGRCFSFVTCLLSQQHLRNLTGVASLACSGM